jgi:hypothetical protein
MKKLNFMKKYRFIDSGESFVLGGQINLQVLADENLVSQLLEAGIIEEEWKLSMDDIVEHLYNRINCDVYMFLENLEKVNKKALFILLLKEAALVLDNEYDGHIKYADELWGVSLVNYTPFLMTKEPGLILNTNFTKIAAFRCKEDAEAAVEVLKPLIDELK